MPGPRLLSAEPGTLCQWCPEIAFCADLEVCLFCSQGAVSGALEYSAFEPEHLYMDCVVRPGAPADIFHMFNEKQPAGLAGAPQDAVPFAHSTQRSGPL